MIKNKILIVDDEQGIVNMLKNYFEFHGYLVFTAINGYEALKSVHSKPDIILLDINLPDIDGLEVCKLIREHVACPIVFLTARIEESDQVIGFQSGGDDYIVKPFKVNELGARVAAHLRRENRTPQNLTVKFFDRLAINYILRRITYSEIPMSLTKKEFDIVELLTLNQGQVFDKERIYEHVWGYDRDGDSTVVVEHIRRIRQKLLEHTGKAYIETVWGVGYKWKK